jgi:hypothetical protein
MPATIAFNYDQVFELVMQLSPAEQTRLVQELPKETIQKVEKSRESFIPEDDGAPYSHEEFLEFLLHFPVIGEEQIQLMLEAREEVNKCQPISW